MGIEWDTASDRRRESVREETEEEGGRGREDDGCMGGHDV